MPDTGGTKLMEIVRVCKGIIINVMNISPFSTFDLIEIMFNARVMGLLDSKRLLACCFFFIFSVGVRIDTF